jgi:hypothetical protein
MLLALAQKVLAQARNSGQVTDQPVGTLTRDAPYEQLRYAEIDGIPGTVTIDRTGEMAGFSPVERCTVNGETAWIPLHLVKNMRLQPFPFVGAVQTPTR